MYTKIPQEYNKDEKLKEEMELLASDEVQDRIFKIKERLGLHGGVVSRKEHYNIYEALTQEGYDVRNYLQYQKDSDDEIDSIVLECQEGSEDYLKNRLKNAGYEIIKKPLIE